MIIDRRYTASENFGKHRSKSDIKYIVILESDGKPVVHYYIQGDKVINTLPDEYMSQSVNGARLSKRGIYHGVCTMYNCITIGISEAPDIKLCRNLIMTLEHRYSIDRANVLRLSDVTGETNPKMWQDNYIWQQQVIDNISFQ